MRSYKKDKGGAGGNAKLQEVSRYEVLKIEGFDGEAKSEEGHAKIKEIVKPMCETLKINYVEL